ncbi:hypothetical protein [Maribacter sp. 2-571]|uniref:hypothetical protein n=1 Tax=Maribacter sp. 2-571 TaxID=3417569 RepID=UPI003D330294
MANDNMYTGKSSRNPNSSLITGLLIGLGLIAFGVYLYYDLAAWEQSNEQMHLHRLLWGIYDLGGKLAVAGFFALCGAIGIGGGAYKSWKLRQIRDKRD